MPRKRRKPISPPPAVPANDQQGAILTMPDLMKRWRVSNHTIRQAILDGRLSAFKVGRSHWRFREVDVVAYEQNTQPVEAAS